MSGAADENFNEIELIFGRPAIVVGRIAFRRCHFAHFAKRFVGDRFAAQDLFGLPGVNDGGTDGVETDANVFARAVAGLQRQRDAHSGEVFDAARRKLDMRPARPLRRRDVDLG